MPKNPNNSLWRFPDHRDWAVDVKVNSQSKKNLITDIKEVLSRCGMVQRFRQGPFGKYLDLPQPLRIHGLLIYNLLKREVVIAKQREDEIWLGIGRTQIRFGKEEFCVCSGLRMGPLPQGFNKKKDGKEGSLLKRYFKEKRPSAELLYAIMKRLTREEGEDVLKMASIFMLSQFFGTDDGRKAIPEWMFGLVEDEEAFKKFPWGSYIYSVTLFWLKRFTQQHLHALRGTSKEEEKKKEAEGRGKNKMKGEDGEEEDGEEEDGEEDKETEGQEGGVDENKEIEGQQGSLDENRGQLPEIEVPVEKKKKSKYHTLNIYGFTLPFQVWAVERITRLSDVVGTQSGTGFPRFTRWNFNRRVTNIESKFVSSMSCFPWDVKTYEKGSDYYKSLTPDYVCGPLIHKGKGLLKAAETVIEQDEKVGSSEDHDQNFKLDGGDECMYNRTTASFVGSPDDHTPSRKKLFDDTEFQTQKSTFPTSIPPSTIAELYSAIATLIKESEERQQTFFTSELTKIREEMKKGDIREEMNEGEIREDMKEGETREEMKEGETREETKVGDTPANKSRDEKSGTSKQNNDKVSEEDLNGEILSKPVEKSDVEGDVARNQKMEDSDAPADSKMDKDVDNQTILDENELKAINECVELCIEGMVQKSKPLSKKSVQQSICLDDVASPSVVAYDVADPSVTYKDQDKARARKRIRYLNNHWINPLARKRLKSSASDIPSSEGEITNVEFTAFLKAKQPTRLYTGQIQLMEQHALKELVDPIKLISDMHIHSYFDVLWRRRSTPDVNYLQNIALVNVTFYVNLKRRWDSVMEQLDSIRAIQAVEMSEQEKGNDGKVKEVRKKESKTTKGKKKDPPPPVVEVWNEYPEFNPLEFEPDTDWLRVVTGHDLLYSDPWWKMDSVLIPCNTGNHWVLCQVFLKKGEVHLYDSLWPRKGNNARLKDIRCLLYLFPSILKHSGYYEETKSDPHTSAFTASNISPKLIPQQNDGASCGVFMLKYAELILSGSRLPWKDDFSQKDIPEIRKAMAVDIFTNGQLVNSP